MTNYTYTYLVGGLILLSVWIIFFFWRKDLRREIWYGSLLALPFGFAEFFFVPQYWDPPSIFGLIHKFGFGIESFMFAFVCGGITAAIFEVVRDKKLVRHKKIPYHHFFPFYGMVLVFLILELIYPHSIIDLYLALLTGAALVVSVRPDLIKHSAFSGLFFMILYFWLFLLIITLYPGYVQAVYNFKNISGVLVFGMPLEEVLFGFCLGACWSIFYDYARNFRDVKRV